MQKVIERILNLLAFLLTVERPVTADEIRHTVAGYDRERDTAFHRTFERDKALLRRLGIPIEREATDLFEVEFGYVIDRDAYALEDPGLTDEERTALALAVQAVGFGSEPSSHEALLKLGGATGSLEGTQLGADLGRQAETLAAVFGAVSERKTVSFVYRDRPRLVEPYALVHRRGRWYLVAREMKEGRVKVFRLDRGEGYAPGDRANAFARPEGFDARAAVMDHPWDTGEDAVIATVAFDADIAWIAQRELGAGISVNALDDGAIEATVQVGNADAFVGWVLGFEDKAEILAPEELRNRLLALVAPT